jgi:hypothetical protein
MSGLWWQQPFRMYQTNLRLVDVGMDVDVVAETVREHGANAWLVNTGGIYANYPSALSSQVPNPHLSERGSGDLVGDALEAAHSRGLRFMARMDFSKVVAELAAQHPEWLYVSSTGERQIFNGLVSTCPSAAYFQQETFAILDEVMDRYAVDGFFFNWFIYSEFNYAYEYLGPCHCAACQALFPAEAGLSIPSSREDPTYPAWQAWSQRMLLDIGHRIRDHIHDRLPEAGLILSDTADLRYEEANNAVGRDFWPHQTGENVSSALTHLPEVPVLVNCVSFLDFPYRMGEEEPERFAQYLIQSFARGASISTYIMGYPGRIHYGSLGLAGEITRYHRDHESWYRGLRQSARVLLVTPGPHWIGLSLSDAVAEYRGLFNTLQQLHIPFDVVDVAHLPAVPAEEVGRYRLIIAPDLGELSEGAAALLDAFVTDGGALLATGSSGWDGPRAQLASLGVAGRTSIHSSGELLSSYIETSPGRVVPLSGTYFVPELRPGAEPAMHVLPPAPFGPPELCYGHTPSDDPGVVFATLGKGRSAVIPWSVGRAYYTIGTRVIRSVVETVLRELIPDLSNVETDLPEAVEIVAATGDRGELLHLISHAHLTRTSYSDPIPLVGHRLRIRGRSGWSARSLVHDRALTTSSDGEWLDIELPPIGRFDAIALEKTP